MGCLKITKIERTYFIDGPEVFKLDITFIW